MVRRLVKYGPGHKRDAGIEWLSRSVCEPGCLSGLVRRRLLAKPETRVRVLALPTPKILQKSSKSEKILDCSPLDLTCVPFMIRFVSFMVRSVSFMALPCHLWYAVRRVVCSFDLSGILKCYLEPLLCRFAGTRTLVSTFQVQLLNHARIPTIT